MTDRRLGLPPLLLAFSLLVPVALAPAGCASSSAGSDTARAGGKEKGKGGRGVGKPMPSVVVKEVDGGRRIDLGALEHKAVLVDIWASWCGPCKEEMPLLDKMAGRLKDKGIAIIAVSIDEDRDSMRTFLESQESWALTVAHDPKGKLPELLRPAKMPTSYVLDGEGIIRYVNEGFERDDVKRIEARLKALADEAS